MGRQGGRRPGADRILRPREAGLPQCLGQTWLHLQPVCCCQRASGSLTSDPFCPGDEARYWYNLAELDWSSNEAAPSASSSVCTAPFRVRTNSSHPAKAGVSIMLSAVLAHDSGEEAASSSAQGWRIHHALEGGCFPGTGSGAASATSTAPGPTHAGGCLFCIWRNRVALYLLWPKELRPSLHPLEAAYLQSLGGETALE